jgi:hypothetical protein
LSGMNEPDEFLLLSSPIPLRNGRIIYAHDRQVVRVGVSDGFWTIKGLHEGYGCVVTRCPNEETPRPHPNQGLTPSDSNDRTRSYFNQATPSTWSMGTFSHFHEGSSSSHYSTQATPSHSHQGSPPHLDGTPSLDLSEETSPLSNQGSPQYSNKGSPPQPHHGSPQHSNQASPPHSIQGSSPHSNQEAHQEDTPLVFMQGLEKDVEHILQAETTTQLELNLYILTGSG